MPTAADLTSTPLAYATPEQAAQAQELADLLTKSAQSNQLIRSPWQGIQRMVEATMGGLEARRAAQQAQQGRNAAAGQVVQGSQPNYAVPPATVAPTVSPSTPPTLPPSAGTAASGGWQPQWNPNWGTPSTPTGAGAQPWGILAPPQASAFSGGS
jgi:hypothetical protein